VLTAAALALSAWQGGLSRDSAGAHWSVALLAIGAVVAAVILGWGRQHRTSRVWVAGAARAVWSWRSRPRAAVAAVVAWTVLFVAVIGWDVTSFIYQSHNLPTLSYFIGHVTRYPVGRGALFAVWLGIGAYLVAGRREVPR
jgi:hypothetical protein